jgi:acetyl/propionyl-CoA carboxylase alpha subunit
MLIHLYSEDERLRLPRPGKVRALNKKRFWRHLGGEARLLLSIDLGESVPYESDGHLGFLSIQAKDRENAFSFANLILSDFWMAGSLQVNDAFTAQVLQHAWVKEGLFHAGFIDEDFIPFLDPPDEIQRISVSLCQELDPKPHEKGDWLYGERIVFPSSLKWKWRTGPYRFSGGFAGTIQWDGKKKVPVMVSPLGTVDRWLVRLGPYTRIVRRTRKTKKGRKILYAQVSGRVHSIRFQEGVLLPAHEPVVIIESLQNLIPHSLPIPMRVKKWFIRAENRVVLGQELAELESGL